MRLTELRRDPHKGEVAPRHVLVHIHDSCELAVEWPRTDPAFFESAAACIIARSLGDSRFFLVD